MKKKSSVRPRGTKLSVEVSPPPSRGRKPAGQPSLDSIAAMLADFAMEKLMTYSPKERERRIRLMEKIALGAAEKRRAKKGKGIK